MAVRYHREHMLDDPPNMVDLINYRVNVIYLHLWTAQKHSEHISGRTRPPHQCVTVPKIFNDTDTDTFFRYQIFPIPIPVLFPVPNFSDTGSEIGTSAPAVHHHLQCITTCGASSCYDFENILCTGINAQIYIYWHKCSCHNCDGRRRRNVKIELEF